MAPHCGLSQSGLKNAAWDFLSHAVALKRKGI
jgi:hypothetical protein